MKLKKKIKIVMTDTLISLIRMNVVFKGHSYTFESRLKELPLFTTGFNNKSKNKSFNKLKILDETLLIKKIKYVKIVVPKTVVDEINWDNDKRTKKDKITFTNNKRFKNMSNVYIPFKRFKDIIMEDDYYHKQKTEGTYDIHDIRYILNFTNHIESMSLLDSNKKVLAYCCTL